MSITITVDFPPELVEAIADRVAERLSAPALRESVAGGKLAVPISEAAELIGVSEDHFRRHIGAELRIVRSGRLRLVPVAELEAWLDRHAARVLAEGPR